MVLLCDVDHGLVHEHDLVLSRPGGRLLALGRDGRRVWWPAEGTSADPSPSRFRGTAPGALYDLLHSPAALPSALPSDGDRLDLQHTVWALMAHRAAIRRHAA